MAWRWAVIDRGMARARDTEEAGKGAAGTSGSAAGNGRAGGVVLGQMGRRVAGVDWFMVAAMLLWSSMTDASPLAAFAPYAIAGVALVLVYAVLAALLKPKAKLERRPLLTKAELELLTILRALLPRHHVNCQVSMGALLKPRAGLSRKAYSLSRNKVSQKVVDFVVMDPASGEVDAVIELDDRSHDARKDAARDKLLTQGRYQVIRIPSRPRPTREIVAQRLMELRARD
ncbi:DUF2726 domain-containing protein [Aureimonas sp. AU20]|uniref:DUF2726 domain-containing protein n=3 Tax=unclassified Aureimonas TaxID=2615206 RepID=UPI0011DFA673|nr:DUF2726 domain-containing protein [Aureimonas sp. AU20]